VDILTIDEKFRLIALIRDKLGFHLTLAHFTEVAFDLFEDIAGMEDLPIPDATEIINSMWSIYRAN
jgi:hypothetical protein